MPFWRTYYHLVWATGDGAPTISPAFESRLFDYLRKRARHLGVRVYALEGLPDHVHLVVSIPPSMAVSEFVRQLKGASSRYVNRYADLGEHFHWQRGYGAMTLGERQRAKAEAYLRGHDARHRQGRVNRWMERTYEFDEGPRDSDYPSEGLWSSLEDPSDRLSEIHDSRSREPDSEYHPIEGHGFPF